MPQVIARRLYVPETALVARTFLSELRAAHRALLGQLSAMEALVAQPGIDPGTCATRRWRLSQAGLARRLVAARVCDYFLTRLGPAQVAKLKQLIEEDQALLRESSAHLGRWGAEAVRQDWPSFCRDARAMCEKAQAFIAAEQKLVYPILEELADRS